MSKTLFVDLDGTLVGSDTLVESVFLMLRDKPVLLFSLPFWLLKGRAVFKAKVSEHVALDPAKLPYNKDFLAYLRRERAMGTRLVLATAANQTIARGVFEHVGLFDSVLASDEQKNLKGKTKLTAILEKESVFHYAGNDTVDLSIWEKAEGAVVVGSAALKSKAEKLTKIDAWFAPEKNSAQVFAKALRVHQWAKNLLLFLPIFLAHGLTDVSKLRDVFWAWLLFSLVASSVYLLNDLVDIDSDRQHPKKSKRPLASGAMQLHVGALLSFLTFLGGFIGAMFVSTKLVILLGTYYVITTLYSFWLKRISLVDTFTLAGLFTWRIFSGGKVADVPLSFWLLAFSMFFFLSLAFAKRAAELHTMKELGRKKASGRGYNVTDLDTINQLGIGAGIGSIVILTLYVSQPSTTILYGSPDYLLAACIAMFYWIARIWVLTSRGQMNEDPVAFAMKDPVSYGVFLVVLLAGIVAHLV